jgi:pyridoxine 5-phosphate synthase
MEAVATSERAGADGITMHLREDRRHIQTKDIYKARKLVTTSLNLEMAATDEMTAIALDVRPDYCCIVPERREELTTEGGLDLARHKQRLFDVCQQLAAGNLRVSLFIEPAQAAIDLTLDIGAPIVELHTGAYADASGGIQAQEFRRLEQVAAYAASAGLQANAGHGLHYDNVVSIASIPQLKELNIGHAIVARALFVGLENAVHEMKETMTTQRGLKS